VPTLPNFLLDLSKPKSAVISESLKAASTHINGFLKTARNFMKKSVKNCILQWLQEPVYVGTIGFCKLFYDSTRRFLNLLNQ
jgi:hypothetical protein